MLNPRSVWDIPEETARVAQAAFPKGNMYLILRDELGMLYRDSEYADLFVWRGQPAESPGMLSMVTVMQFAEGLTDRQAAEAVRGRIDWKYTLGLELTDPGFHHSVLGDFRQRVIEGGKEAQLLDGMLVHLKARGWVKARGRQRTDSSHVLAVVRQLNRLECVGESMRQALNDLAAVAPDWLLCPVTADWFDLYGARFEAYRLPKEQAEKEALQLRVGQDGYHLLRAIYEPSAPAWLRQLPAVQILRHVWIQQYYLADDQVHWRTDASLGLPPHKLLIQSPYDPEARNRTKRSTNWTGYAIHMTETCDAASPHLLTHVVTTQATTADVEVTGAIHQALADKDLLPAEHFVDTSYVDAPHLVSSQEKHHIDLVGPAPPDPSWQAKAQQGFDIACFAIDWQVQTVICPRGHASYSWRARQDEDGRDVIEVRFAKADCLACSAHSLCTRSQMNPRTLRLRPQAQHEALQQARQRQQTEAFKQAYRNRAGIEGTISQGMRRFELRRSRYVGLAKTHFQNVATAAAINVVRLVAWLQDTPVVHARQSRFAALRPCA